MSGDDDAGMTLRATMRTIVCVGPPLAGKTTLLAAWYNELQRNPAFTQVRIDIQPDGHDSNDYLAGVVAGIREQGRGPSRNEEGSIHRVRLLCTSKIRPQQVEALEFYDFSGETFRSALAADSAAAMEALSDTEREVIAVSRRADLLIFVLNAEDFCRESANPLYESLSFIDSFFSNRAIRLQLEHTCSIYLTHCDKLDSSQVKAVSDELRATLARKGLASLDSRIYACASVRTGDGGGVVFTAKDDPLSPGPAIARWMVGLIERRGAGGLPRWLGWLVGLLLLITVGAAGAYWVAQKVQAEQAWKEHLRHFEGGDWQTIETLSNAELKQALGDLEQWKRVAIESHGNLFAESPVRTRVVLKLDELKLAIEQQAPQPVALPQLENEVRELWAMSRQDREMFFRELAPWAAERMTDAAYGREARRVLEQLAAYAAGMNAGFHLQIRSLRLDGPKLSGRLSAEGNIMVTLHIIDSRPPYFAGADAVPPERVSGLALPSAAAVLGHPAADRVSYTWQGPVGPSRRSFGFGDEVWLRGYRERAPWRFGTSTELFAFSIPPIGVDGFGEGRVQKFTREFGQGRFTINVAIVPITAAGETIDAPEFLRKILH